MHCRLCRIILYYSMSALEGSSQYWNHRHDVELLCAVGKYCCHGTHNEKLLENIHNAYCKLKLYYRLTTPPDK